MGGGDVKLLGAAALLVPPATVPHMLALVAFAGGILALIYLVGRAVAPRPAGRRPHMLPLRILRAECWRIRRGGPLPYACAIAAGAALTLFQIGA
jgi:prepilin peptidase CpaA